MYSDDELREVARKYGARFGEMGYEDLSYFKVFSKEYDIFRKESLAGSNSLYEKLCNFAGRTFNIKANKKDEPKIKESIEVSHLNITTSGATSFAVFISLVLFLFGILIGVLSLVITGQFKVFLPLLIIFGGVVAIKPLSKLPNYFASRWRLEASNQMVLCILYIVMYMRHTSNLEHAIKFAGEHIGAPLNLDLRKVFWNVEVGKYSTIKESLDRYLEMWRGYNLEFIEAFHLIEGSLSEPNEDRRVELLDKALNVMLEGTYEDMLHYAHDLKSPITMLHMMGVILPILGLVIFPLLGSFLQGLVKWYHLAFLYNLILPAAVYFYGVNLLSKRPNGYGEASILKTHPEFKKYQNINFLGRSFKPGSIALLIFVIFLIIGLVPLFVYVLNPEFDFNFLGGKFLDFQCDSEGCKGPYGVGAMLLGLLIPLGLALSVSFYFIVKTKRLVSVRKKLDDLEQEFSGSLFQLGSRIGDGLPAEIAFGEVARNMRGTPTGSFFNFININLRQLGMGLREAIFNEERGAVMYFPSKLIESSMMVLLEGAKRSPQVVAKSLISISEYVSRIRSVNERLKDLLADILSSMKSQVLFLTPMIAGIVVGVGSMIVSIINLLGQQFQNLPAGETGELGGVGGLVGIFNIKDVIPGYYFQLVVGLFVVETIIILSILANGIERGVDDISEKNSIAKNLRFGMIVYTVICIIGILIFTLLAGTVVSVTAGI